MLCSECYTHGKNSTRPMRRDGIRTMLHRARALQALTFCEVSYWLGVARR